MHTSPPNSPSTNVSAGNTTFTSSPPPGQGARCLPFPTRPANLRADPVLRDAPLLHPLEAVGREREGVLSGEVEEDHTHVP